VTSKGQITIPAAVRQALHIREGDQVVFELEQEAEGSAARLRRAADFWSLAGTMPPRSPVPKTWAEERRQAREEAIRGAR
jgi:AbrB family looped-hinge helix DNA binding protein